MSITETDTQYAVLVCPGCDRRWPDSLPSLPDEGRFERVFRESLLDWLISDGDAQARELVEAFASDGNDLPDEPLVQKMRDRMLSRLLRQSWPLCPECNRRGRVLYLLVRE